MTGRGLPKIRVRLTLWYAGTIVLVLLAFTAVLRSALSEALERNFDRSVQESLRLVSSFYNSELHEYGTPEATAKHVGTELVFPARQVEFVRPDGSVLVVPASRPVGGPLRPPLRRVERPLDARTAPGWSIRMHASAAELEQLHRRVDRWFLVSIPLAALLALLAGWLVTGRTLAPVGEMAAATERITPGEPARRIPVADPSDELGRLGLRFNALLDRLDQALAQQRRFLADAEHELRTPIARMRNRVDVALLAPPGPGDRAALEEVEADLRRASRLVAELLLLARADASPATGRLERGYLDDIAMTVLATWREAAAAAGVGLVAAVVEETPAMLDAALAERMLGILVDNAIRYTPAGGCVELHVEPRGDRALVEVRDSGIGIPAGELARVFERFYRGAAARQRQPEGSGLGLSIAEWIAGRHGGSIRLEPGKGGGTVARVEMPLAT